MSELSANNPNNSKFPWVSATGLAAIALAAVSVPIFGPSIQRSLDASAKQPKIPTYEPASAHIIYHADGTANQITNTEMRDKTNTQKIRLRCLDGRMYATDPLNGYISGMGYPEEKILVRGVRASVACSDGELDASDKLTPLRLQPDDYVANIAAGSHRTEEIIDS